LTNIQPPSVTRHRRPFLAPIWLAGAAFLLAVVVLVALYRSMTITTYVIVRHAEKQLGTIDDPPLAPEGEARAERLARMFGDGEGVGAIRAIYVTDTRRTQQTVAPLAARLRLKPVVLPAADVQGAIARARVEHRGSNVLFVAHSNTIPQILHRLSGVSVPETEQYGDLYVVSVPTLGPASVLRLTY
jgi:broad specificity phosphatase PhoE